MPNYSLTPDRLLDRPWRPGHPFRPKTGRIRRLGMFALLLVLSMIIGGYAYLTDALRVRRMAEGYLSGLVGGRVTVGQATLSVFEGLRLDDVHIYLSNHPFDGATVREGGLSPEAVDAHIFSARTLVIAYNYRSMLKGQLEATQIVAEKPHLYLTHDVARGTWNFMRFGQGRPKTPETLPVTPGPPSPPPPELMLRNARVELSELRDGRKSRLGYVALDGQLTPEGGGERYSFVVQSRGVSDTLGAWVSGSVSPATGQVAAELRQFEFGQDVQSLLPEELRQWWSRHELTGRIDVPRFEYTPGRDGKPDRFVVKAVLNDVNLSVPADDWASAAELRQRNDVIAATDVMRRAFELAGARTKTGPILPAMLNTPPPGTSAETSSAGDGTPRLPTLDRANDARTPIDALTALLQPHSIHLRHAAGAFVFTEQGVSAQDLTGRVENNAFKINGQVAGFRPNAILNMRIESLETEDLNIPAAPGYIWSLPKAVRDIYTDLRPQGNCRLKLDVYRRVEGGPIEAGGVVYIRDGRFVVKDFPYPLRDVNGELHFGRDPSNGRDWIVLRGMRGHGVLGGPNQEKTLGVDGWIGPLGDAEETGYNLHIFGKDISSEPILLAAFSEDVREALGLFDPDKKGLFPEFRGDFATRVIRPVGYGKKFTYDTDIHLAEASGALVDFPYPLRRLSGDLHIRDGYVDLVNMFMRRGDATVAASGRVAWESEHVLPDGSKPQTEIQICVRGVPVDDDLLRAIPGDNAKWVRKTGVQGKIDADGRIWQIANPPTPRPKHPKDAPTEKNDNPLMFDLALKLKDASARPDGGTFEITSLNGGIRLTPDRLELQELSGRHGPGELTGSGTITWPNGIAKVGVRVSARGLPLDKDLYQLIPDSARSSWDEVQPVGTIDADLTYATETVRPAGAVMAVDLTQPTTLPASADLPPGLHATLKPRELSATLKAVPLKLDHLAGSVVISPGKVELKDMTGRHGDARIALAGVGYTEGPSVWDLRLAADGLTMDEDFRNALPASIRTLTDGLKLKGKIGISLPKLVHRSPPANETRAGTQPAEGDSEIDLAGSITLADASIDAGVPLEQVAGVVTMTDATVRRGKLDALSGNVKLSGFSLSNRSVEDFRMNLSKPSGKAELLMDRLQGRLAGGDLGGQVLLQFPDDGPSRYTISLAVRGADVKELAQEQGQTIAGLLTASLSMEGPWGKPEARRGRGDIVMAGKDMYRIPLLLGLMQVTNLALPISAPFENGVARYSIDGQKIMFERIELRSNNMLMTGDGSLDFKTKQVRMTFVTDNPGAFKVPFLQDLWRGAQQELLRIHVKGTVKEPKVEAGMFGTVTTTVDEVFKGDSPKGKKRP